ncbi:MAG: hypothetical protein D6824_08235 [Planctomycetota bacterium]|nr:MAG: hypothetical protein D6824_08235 [Planctomycetota bacterium]
MHDQESSQADNAPSPAPQSSAAAAPQRSAAAQEAAAISPPSRLGWKPLTAAGAAALFAAGAVAGAEAWGQASSGRLVAFLLALASVVVNGLIRMGLGVAAVYIVARVLEAPVGQAGLAAARMLLAVGLFYLAHAIVSTLGLHPVAAYALGAAAGAAVYYIVVMWSFRLEREGLLLLGAAHFLLWLATKVAVTLELAVRATLG